MYDQLDNFGNSDSIEGMEIDSLDLIKKQSSYGLVLDSPKTRTIEFKNDFV